MSKYVNIIAKDGCSEQINELWLHQFELPIIYTAELIQQQIEFVRGDPRQQYLASQLDTVEDWNRLVPVHAENCGQLFFLSEEYDEQYYRYREQVQWLLDHRLLFKSITGLQDAIDELDMDIDGDAIIDGRLVHVPVLTFEDLPKLPNSKIYQYVQRFDRPDLWQGYLNFKEHPTEESWYALRHMIMPRVDFLREKTVWATCEAFASRIDGKGFGLTGRYREGEFPTAFEIEKAFQETIKMADEQLNREDKQNVNASDNYEQEDTDSGLRLV
ncbi:hypothetical protein Q9L42_020735 (plasmid) [Methylomarinum sp. Ch1-1]|uniref:DUF4123 domain-containing protein n=1 Tax=Methylomarinum roseum TaxID=3067653 RepID=A0AAU7P0G0_9GAMM|nr:hypothetical protein [Methylomarinum sp. Ch1-1]MDP4518946.1 hypothetical protein [Methylomarinum sp. Ch1-1]MDP4523346.1 hypothetical protein [Methylomarinum sp. Ch1-1]